jgi:hypothetical protein
MPGSLQPGEEHIGAIGGHTAFVPFTLSLDTNAYADGDVLADTQTIANVFRAADVAGHIESIILNDEDDQGIALDLWFLSAATSLGTENSAPNISDANSRTLIGKQAVAATDFYDLGGVRVAYLKNLWIPIKPIAGTTSLAMAAISRGAGTYSAAGITGFLEVARD